MTDTPDEEVEYTEGPEAPDTTQGEIPPYTPHNPSQQESGDNQGTEEGQGNEVDT